MTDPKEEFTVAELKQFVSNTLAGKKVRRLRVSKALFLEARPRTQSASWVLRFTVAGKKASKGYGRFPGVGLAEARRKAAADRELLDAGVNPSEAKRTGLMASRTRLERSVQVAVDQWLELDTAKLTSPKYAAQKGARLYQVLEHHDKGQLPLGRAPVALVTVEDVTTAMQALSDTPETARRVLRDLEKAFDWARGMGWRLDANPCSGVMSTLAKPKRTGHRAPKAAELGDVVRKLWSLLCPAGTAYDYGGQLTRLLLLTAARTGEVRLALWSEVKDLDGDEPRIEVPETRMKRRRAWTVPLSTQAVEVLRDLRKRAQEHGDTDPRVFYRYGFTGRGSMTSENAVNDVLKRAGLHGVLVGHGLRKLFSTAAHASWQYSGLNRDKAIEMALAHETGTSVETTYNRHDFMAERRQLAQWWADLLDRLAKPEGGSVVPINRAPRAA
ncbi:MAG: tyrosine-type recombinase/integrase [Variovorax sp.]|nr:tyrosine-type recombinase/integrase [Variovorax sp.]